jgi:hypothetical protein
MDSIVAIASCTFCIAKLQSAADTAEAAIVFAAAALLRACESSSEFTGTGD